MICIIFFSQESASERFSVAGSLTGWWCQTRGVTAQPDLLSSLSPATLNVNSGLFCQFNQPLVVYETIMNQFFTQLKTLTRMYHPGRRWHVARKSECTAQCGLGYRTLEIYCAKISRADGKTQKVDDRYCSSQRKPDDKEGCHGDCNPGGWEYTPWSEVRVGLRSVGSMCERNPPVCQNVLCVVYMCLHPLMSCSNVLHCSAPRAVEGAPAVEGQRVERQLRLAVMRANAVKGTS